MSYGTIKGIAVNFISPSSKMNSNSSLETPSRRKRDENVDPESLVDCTPQAHGSSTVAVSSRSAGSSLHRPLKRRLLTAFDDTESEGKKISRRRRSRDSSRSASRSPQPSKHPHGASHVDVDDSRDAAHRQPSAAELPESLAARGKNLTERQQLAMLLQMTANDTQHGSDQEADESCAIRPRVNAAPRDQQQQHQVDDKLARRIPARLTKRNERGETPLHVASIRGDAELVAALIARGADVTLRDNAGWTPLHEACSHGHLGVVTQLLDAGAPLHATGYGRDRPLHDAASNGYLDVVRQLVAYGADASLRNAKGERAVDYAASLDHAAVVEFLQTCAERTSVSPAPPAERPSATSTECEAVPDSNDDGDQRTSIDGAPGQGLGLAPAVSSSSGAVSPAHAQCYAVAEAGSTVENGGCATPDASSSLAVGALRMSLFEKFSECEVPSCVSSSPAESETSTSALPSSSPVVVHAHSASDGQCRQPQALAAERQVSLPRKKRGRSPRPRFSSRASDDGIDKSGSGEPELHASARSLSPRSRVTSSSGTDVDEAAEVPCTPKTPFRRSRSCGSFLPTIDSCDSGIATSQSYYEVSHSPCTSQLDATEDQACSPPAYRKFECARFDISSLGVLRQKRGHCDDELAVESSTEPARKKRSCRDSESAVASSTEPARKKPLVPMDPVELAKFIQHRQDEDKVLANDLAPSLPNGSPPELHKLQSDMLRERYNLKGRFKVERERLARVFNGNQRRIVARCSRESQALSFCQIEIAQRTNGDLLEYCDAGSVDDESREEQLSLNEKKRVEAMGDLTAMNTVEWDGLLGLQCMQWKSLCSRLGTDVHCLV